MKNGISKNIAGIAEINAALFDILETRPQESVCQWVEKHIELPTGSITGRVSLKKTPHAREILERFADKTARHLVLAFATQTWDGWDYIPHAWPVWLAANDGVLLVATVGAPAGGGPR